MKRCDEFSALPTAASSERRIDELARWLVQYAARSAPGSLSERLEEEWLAHLETRRGRMAQLLFGAGCCWATRVIAYEHCEEKVPATSPAAGQKVMTAYSQTDSSFFFSRRTTILVLIIGLHVLLIYAVQTGLTHQMVESIPQPILAEFMKDRPTPDVPPPPPSEPELVRPRVNFPQPDITVDVPPGPDTIQEVTPQTTEQIPPPPVPQRLVKRVLGGPGKGFPDTDDYYPATARRMGEQGVTTVRACVDDRGRLTENPTLAESSGSARLDEGALKLAKAGSGRYRATTEDGRPVSSCYPFRIKFQLRD